ncbi:MAG: hypothetical protein HN849_03810 [Victivallales bacterium]|nr:hypothetical protein [Victivallales bacterium]MBT7298609.1 hypothetical protein [Victivallales bacterium]
MAILRRAGLAAALLALLTVAAAQTDRRNVQMERRRQELKLELLRERARIIRDDPDAASLRGRIEALQAKLGRLVDDKPAVRRLVQQGKGRRLELLRERARIIRDDPIAARLREQVEKSQLELGRLVDAEPAVQRLRAELAAVEKVLKREPRSR